MKKAIALLLTLTMLLPVLTACQPSGSEAGSADGPAPPLRWRRDCPAPR